jgi:hypothetical protein
MDLPTDDADYCNPLGTFDSPESLQVSIAALVIMYFICYFIALMIMKILSTKYE